MKGNDHVHHPPRRVVGTGSDLSTSSAGRVPSDGCNSLSMLSAVSLRRVPSHSPCSVAGSGVRHKASCRPEVGGDALVVRQAKLRRTRTYLPHEIDSEHDPTPRCLDGL